MQQYIYVYEVHLSLKLFWPAPLICEPRSCWQVVVLLKTWNIQNRKFVFLFL